ncbi:MAG TPA: alpha/beta hydrolase [Azospirillum sp.]|nr:alpha/beta hydrolase [Azospirillum sp.]
MKLASAILIGLVLYAVLVSALYAMQRPMIFRADLAPTPPALNSVPGFQEVHVRTEDGLDLRSLYRPAEGDRPTLLFFHGNADGLSGALQATSGLVRHGYGIFLLEYRGYARNPGKPSEDGLYADGRGALRWLDEHGVSSARIVLAGNSLGSGVAVELAASHQVAGLVLISAYTSLPDVAAAAFPFVPVRLLMRDRFDNIGKLSRVKAPILILHGTNDLTIPHSHAVALAGEAGPRGKLETFPGLGHELVYDPVISPVIERWLSALGMKTISKP